MQHVIYRFAGVRIDPLARELHRDGEVVALSPKVFDCLVYLIEHRDRAVGRDELIAAIWGKVELADSLLGQTLLKARRIVGDDGNGQHAIRTIPRFGYRWIGEIQVETAVPTPTEAAPPAPAVVAEAAAPDVAPRRRSLSPILAVALLAIAAVAAIALLRRPTTIPPAVVATAAATGNTVAVLPAVVQGDPQWSWLRLGLMDLVATRLRQSGQPTVPSDNLVALLRGHEAAAPTSAEVRAATGAGYIVEPRVSRRGKSWQVRLDIEAPGTSMRTVQSEGSDPIETARTAADRLLALLGKSPPRDESGAALSLSVLEQRTEAAILDDDFDEARRLIESAPQQWRDSPSGRFHLAQIEWRTGELDAARTRLESLLSSLDAHDASAIRARALYTLGAINIRQDRNPEAIGLIQQAAALAEANGDQELRGQSYMAIAAANVNLGRFDDAATGFARARVAYAGNTLALARVDANEGVLDNARGRPAEALPVLERAAERFRRFGAMNDLALTVAAQIRAHLALLAPATALATGDALWPQRAALSNQRSRRIFELQYARALAANGRLAEARQRIDELSRDSGGQPGTGLPGDIASERARLALGRGDVSAAIEDARAAIAALPTVDEAPERARAWLTLTRALRQDAQGAALATELDAFRNWSASRTETPVPALFAGQADAEQAWASRHRNEAYRLFDASIADAERQSVPQDLATVAIAYGTLLLDDGQTERAGPVIGRVARWAEQDFDCAVLQARLLLALGQIEDGRAALEHARSLAGERSLPAEMLASAVRLHGT